MDLLLAGKDLSRSQSRNAFSYLLKNKFESEPAKQLLVLLQRKGEHSFELTGFIDAVRALEQPIRFRGHFLVDGCGTGGDGNHTFNISTLACLIAAASGAQVAKHGNRSVSSLCGSSDLLAALGVKINAPKARMLKALKETGFGYFHAPIYHPIFKYAQPIRRELAKKQIKTLFNLAGPFLNPLRPKRQLIGVWKKELVPIMAETAQNLNLKHIIIIWNRAGFDEMATALETVMMEVQNKRVKLKTLNPKQFRLSRNKTTDLNGGTIKQNRQIALDVLSGDDRSPKTDVVLLNAGSILYVSGKTKSISEGIRLAKQALYSQSALKLLNRLVKISHGSR